MKKALTIIVVLAALCTVATAQYKPYDDYSIFAERRAAFLEKIGGDAIAVIATRLAHTRSGDVEHDFRAASNFFYLTGFEEPEAIAVIRNKSQGEGIEPEFILFVQPRNALAETWTGRRFGTAGAMTVFGADTAYDIDEFENLFPRMFRGKSKLYYTFGVNEEREEFVVAQYRRFSGYRDMEMVNASRVLAGMRTIKSEKEIEMIRRAVNITVEAHIEAMRSAQPGMGEYEIEAVIEYIYRKNGCPRVGFPSIVASDPNTVILHYQTNQGWLEKGELLLCDLGAEYGFYSADVTRTFPVSGKFSKEQKAIYQIVYDAQEAGFKLSKPGGKRSDIAKVISETIAKGLLDLGILEGTLEEIMQSRRYSKYYMHGFGHHLGLDVHDANANSSVLKPGMVFTIEPGIYITDDDETVDEKWRGIGVRIEDDVLITEDGYDLLSKKAPRSIKDIEKEMKKKGLAQKD